MNVTVQTDAYAMLIDGRQEQAASGKRIEMVCPSDGQAFASVPRGGKEDIDRAVRAARKAFNEGPWPKMSATDRGRILSRLAALVLENQETLAALEARDTGKTIKSGRFDIAALARYLEFYAGAAD